MVKIAVVLGSTRPGRAGEAVARWVHAVADRTGSADFELVDLLDFDLPLLDEAEVPMVAPGAQAHTRAWAAEVSRFDGFVFVTPEYNHGMPAALKNAIDFLYSEWNGKVVGFVSYGSEGGVRAVEQLRQVVAQVRMAAVGAQVALPLATDFVQYRDFAPLPHREQQLVTMLSDVVVWAHALAAVRHDLPQSA